MISGRNLHQELKCIQRAVSSTGKTTISPQLPLLEYETPLKVLDAQSTSGECRVSPELFEAAPLTGLDVELRLKGAHVINTSVNLIFYPRTVLALADGDPVTLYLDTHGQHVKLRTDRSAGRLHDRQLRC